MAIVSFFRPSPTSSELTGISSCHDLTRHDVAVKVQEDFKDLGGDTLDKLDVYIGHCDAVVHLVGDMCGAAADEARAKRAGGQTFRHPPEIAAARRSAQERRSPSLHSMGGVAGPLPWEAAHDRQGRRRLRAGPTLRDRRRLARGASRTSRTAQGLPPLSRQRVREAPTILRSISRIRRSSICWSLTMPRSSCESATSPRDSSGRWRSASQATRRSISTA